MADKIFITATGTDVGKTYIAALLLKKLRQSGINAGYYKPALSGAYKKNGRLIPGDAEYVLSTAGLAVPPETTVSYIFAPAVSPHLAARSCGVSIEPLKIQQDFAKLSAGYDFMVIEGCGGLTCPLRMEEPQVLLPDIIRLLDAEIIIVAPAGLGTINATLLTVSYARSSGISIRGVILNNFDPADPMHLDNKIAIEKLCGVPVLACVQTGDRDIAYIAKTA